MNVTISQDLDAVMIAALETGLMSSLCTILVSPEEFVDSGAPDPAATWQDLTGHVNIPCTAPPLAIGDKVQPTEVKKLEEILAKNMLHVLLGGYYPAITPTHRAQIDGNVYDIVGVESSSQQRQTRLAVQAVTL